MKNLLSVTLALALLLGSLIAPSIGQANSANDCLLDWFEAMKTYLQAIDAGQAAGLLSTQDIKELENFRKGRGGIPLQQALFKNWETIVDFEKRAHEYINEENR